MSLFFEKQEVITIDRVVQRIQGGIKTSHSSFPLGAQNGFAKMGLRCKKAGLLI